MSDCTREKNTTTSKDNLQRVEEHNEKSNNPGGSKGILNFVTGFLRMLTIFMLVQFIVTKGLTILRGKPQTVDTEFSKQNTPSKSWDTGSNKVTFDPLPQHIMPIWPDDTMVDVRVFVSSSRIAPPISVDQLPDAAFIVNEKKFHIGNFSDERIIRKTFYLDNIMQNNGTLWAHYYISISGYTMDPSSPDYDTSRAYYFTRPLNQYLPKRKLVKLRNLLEHDSKLTGENHPKDQDDKAQRNRKIVSYYHPNLTLSFIPDMGTQSYANLHPAVAQYIQLERTGARDDTGKNGWYYPVLFTNTFWQLRSQMIEINNTVSELDIRITLNNSKMWKFSLMATLDQGMKQNAQKASHGGISFAGDGSELEELKRVLTDSNVYLLTLTAAVSVLHSLFELLAFKNDVSHWRNKKDNIGVSFRTILANIVMQAIILLYLMDNNENTSWVVLIGQFTGIAIEMWKIGKTVNVRLRKSPNSSIFGWRLRFEDKHPLSVTERKTQEYDAIAFYYLYRAAVPLLLAYAGYSLFYQSHKSIYSFVIQTLVGSVYAYGFLMMLPSLYINYRLKSVAHMPGKAMMYKFLNTFIDDLFAFTLKMPTLHRLATFRDDLVFFIYLYQSWKYKVDYTRVNEFGQGGDKCEVDPNPSPPSSSPHHDASHPENPDSPSLRKRRTHRSRGASASAGS